MPEPSALVDATFDLIRAHPKFLDDTVSFFDGQVADQQQPPWVQGFFDPGFRESTAWAQSSDYIDLTVTTICVGTSARTSRRVADWIVDALLEVTPVADGWECHPIKQGPGRDVREDNDIASLWTTVPTWRVRAYTKDTP